jgi:hypothetical protein
MKMAAVELVTVSIAAVSHNVTSWSPNGTMEFERSEIACWPFVCDDRGYSQS